MNSRIHGAQQLRPARKVRRSHALERSATVLIVLLLSGGLIAACSSSACAAPAPTATLRIGQVSPTSASLAWTSESGVTVSGYRIYRGPADAADNALPLIATLDPVGQYTATNLRSGVAYKFGVAAIDLTNTQYPMQTATVSTPPSNDSTPPSPPSNSSVRLTAFSADRIDLAWGPSTSTDIAGYEVRRDDTLVGTVERPNAQRYSDNGLAPSSTHRYTVTAVDSAGNTAEATAPKSATTLGEGAVAIVRGPYLSNVTGTSAIISWWTNEPSPGTVSVADTTIEDPAGVVQHHSVAVSGLSPGVRYPYDVSSGSASSEEGSLRSAARPGQTFSFAAIGDFGNGGPGQRQNVENIGSAGTEFIQTLGDNVYPSAGLPDPDFSTTYSDFDSRFYQPMSALLPNQALFPANGNKEYYADGAFWANFPMPGTNHSWYSYNWGDAHIIVLDTEQSFAPGSEQYAFVQADLNAHQGEAWRIAAFQRPPYSSTSDNSSSRAVGQYLVPLFQTQRVALVLSGNSHNYERTHPLINSEPVDTGGVTYVVSGAGGNGFNEFTMPAPAYSAFRADSHYEFLKVTVSPTALQVDAITGDTYTVFDSTTIDASTTDTTPPTAPTDITVGSQTATGLSLSWKPSADNVAVADYEIYRDGNRTPINTIKDATFDDSGLEPDHGYTYTVVAVDGAGNRSTPSFAVIANTTDANTTDSDGGTAAEAGPPASGSTVESTAPDDCGHGAPLTTTFAGTAGRAAQRRPNLHTLRRALLGASAPRLA